MSNPDNEQVWFSKRQYEYLNKLFNEQTGKPRTHPEYAFSDGVRTVVRFVETKVRGA